MKVRKNKKEARISVATTKATFDKLEKLAEKYDCSTASVVRTAIDFYLKTKVQPDDYKRQAEVITPMLEFPPYWSYENAEAFVEKRLREGKTIDDIMKYIQYEETYDCFIEHECGGYRSNAELEADMEDDPNYFYPSEEEYPDPTPEEVEEMYQQYLESHADEYFTEDDYSDSPIDKALAEMERLREWEAGGDFDALVDDPTDFTLGEGLITE